MVTHARATLILADGTQFHGFSFGAQENVSGECVFQTGMVGYPEALTDPSYRGQLLVLTYPLVGNYGVPCDEYDEHGVPRFFESDIIHARALIVSDYSFDYSHWNAKRSLSQWLKEHNVPGIFGVDTRTLTKKIREHGSILGKIVLEGTDPDTVQIEDPNAKHLVAEVSTKQVRVYGQGNSVRILAVDCGMKANQVRHFLNRGVQLTVVPWDYDFASDDVYNTYDGLFLSNGPGDPTMCCTTIENLRRVFQRENPKPVFGICLGNQLTCLAAGGKTYKMKYGNRGHNLPCVNLKTKRCYITTQNHGFAVDPTTLPEDWEPFFVNANDDTNEGIIHKTKPFFSVQFHPEAKGGPVDTEFLFDMFISVIKGTPMKQALVDFGLEYPGGLQDKRTKVSKVLIVGSGGLSIGQAGEFDYSGSQAIKALKEEKIKTVLINPNIATVQTSPGLADKVYFVPVTPEYIIKVMEAEKPDGILLTFGGQTALNCGISLFKDGIFEKMGVKVLGTPIEAIIATEDRKIFAQKLEEINEKIAPSVAAYSIEESLEAARKIGFPVIVRAGYALGGLGSGFANNEEELLELATKAFSASPQVLVEKSLKGWKEVEYEVIRDVYDNCLTICNMENFDPLGVHTGESIVVAPSQTLTDAEYHMLRRTAINTVRHLGIIGECNIQYALNPNSMEYCIIEVNARLSRSSALASKATGYPLAFVSAKLSLGMALPDLRNSVTKVTTACFEPSLDYCVVKMPRWDLKKFRRVTTRIGSSMKSVGEVMSIGRKFEEAINKACRMVNNSDKGFVDDEVKTMTNEQIDEELMFPTDKRIFVINLAFKRGYSVDKIHSLTAIDKWFLYKLQNIINIEKKLSTYSASTIPVDLLTAAKQSGISDKQIASLVQSTEIAIRKVREGKGIRPFVKQIDTVAAEFPAQNNYLYMTYNAAEDDISFNEHGIIVIGSGSYRIGSSVEFDYCGVSAMRTLRKLGYKSIMINYNPETVSTDYDECDRLYLDELSFERVLDIYSLEKSTGIIISMGGQIGNCLAMPLYRQHCNILGTSPEMIDSAENRYKFSRLLDTIGVDQPEWKELTNVDDIRAFCDKVGYPCLVRPSYVLSGAAMNVVNSPVDLEGYLSEAALVSKEYPVVISKFILEAKEIEMDAVSKDGEIYMYAISEHVENAGVHSGDATLVCPAQDLDEITIRKVIEASRQISRALNITGPFNIQFIAKNDELKVIECNCRASRSFPFISKVFKTDFIEMATKLMLGVEVQPNNVYETAKLDYVGVKVPQFSFTRLVGADPVLGVEMASTGEVACFGRNRYEAYLKGLLSTGFVIPKKNVLLSIGSYKAKVEFLPSARKLVDLGYELFGTPGTSDFMSEHGLKITSLDWPEANGSNNENSIAEMLSNAKIDLFINIPSQNKYRRPASFMSKGYLSRRLAVDFSVPLITNIKCSKLFVEALRHVDEIKELSIIDTRTSNRTVILPGLIDTHVHVREPGGTHKEDWDTCTAAALAGGFTMIGAMPNTNPSIIDNESFTLVSKLAEKKARCDYGIYVGASLTNGSTINALAQNAISLKMYLDPTFTNLRLDDLTVWMEHIKNWPQNIPICVHAEKRNLAAVLLFGAMYDRHIHVCHVSLREEIEIIRAAKERGIRVTCEVAPHHLFFAEEDIPTIFKDRPSRSKVCPHIATARDRDALWANMDVIDSFATDHAPHTLEEKDSATPPPGFPGLETCLPLLLTAVHEGRLTMQDLVDKLHNNPRKIFNLPEQPDTYVEVDLDAEWEIPEKMPFSRCAWTPFAGFKVRGCVTRVVLRGAIAYLDGKVYAPQGFGQDIRKAALQIPTTTSTTKPAAAPKMNMNTALEMIKKSQPQQAHPTQGAVADLPKSPLLSSIGDGVVEKPRPFIPTMKLVEENYHAVNRQDRSNLHGKHVLSVKQFTRNDLHYLFGVANEMKEAVKKFGTLDLLKGRVCATLFYEPSTRTCVSFQAAAQRLGATVVAVNEATSSVAKGESLTDTIQTVGSYADVIVMRHPQAGSAQTAARISRRPIINAGDGIGEHPTQALLDVFTIRDELGTVNGLTITCVGDLKHGRTVHSLVHLLSLYSNITINYVSPPSLKIPREIIEELNRKGVKQFEYTSMDSVLSDTDVLYITRVQKERFEDLEHYESVKNYYKVTPETLTRAKDNMIVMHPLPRVGEISNDVDSDPRAAYFRQMENGMYVRMALLAMVAGKM